jgi:RNA polymerase sigma factor (sigma-70 family)
MNCPMFTIEQKGRFECATFLGGEGLSLNGVEPVVEMRSDRKFVYIVDDNATFRKTIEGRLQEFGYEVISYPSALHLLDRLPSDEIPSCILLDVRLPGMSGPELQERLVELGSALPIIFLTGYPDIRTTVRTIKAGGEDFLMKPVSSEQLRQSVERAIERHRAALNQKRAREVILSRIAKLTPRERQVFQLIVGGKTNKQMGRLLGATERTIKAHRHRVMEKMQVQTLAELVSLAERIGVASAIEQAV